MQLSYLEKQVQEETLRAEQNKGSQDRLRNSAMTASIFPF